LKKRYGNGIIPTVRKASKLVAHWSPSALYICTPKRGNAAEDHGQQSFIDIGYWAFLGLGVQPQELSDAIGWGFYVPPKLLRAKLLAASEEAAYRG
jgi:hypothetical protein